MKVVLTISRFEKQKCYPDNLKTCKELLKLRQDFEFWWVGTGSQDEKFKKLAKGLPIKFLGMRNDIPFLMKKADILFHPSNYEGCSNVLMEAAHLKLPIVCRDIPENKEFFKDCAVFVTSPKDFAGAIHCLLTGLIPKWDYSNQKIFKLERMIKAYEQLYKHVERM